MKHLKAHDQLIWRDYFWFNEKIKQNIWGTTSSEQYLKNIGVIAPLELSPSLK